ncbi:MAG: glycosyltransferase family 4 protein [Candidatus Zixiibacteriota bacterium]|nr:MAG: glycosyltransferase family 4 protein [candidate division Zixibacteria bacterium]
MGRIVRRDLITQRRGADINSGQSHQVNLWARVSQGLGKEGERSVGAWSGVLITVPAYLGYHGHREAVAEIESLLRSQRRTTRLLSYGGPGQGKEPTSVTGSLSGRLSSYLRYIRNLKRVLPYFDILHLVLFPGVSLIRGVLPVVLLARFLGKKVVLDSRGPILISRHFIESFLCQRLWRLCDRVLVQSAYQQQFVSSFGGNAVYVRADVALEEIAPLIVRNLQPKIVVASDLEKEHNVACVIRAFALVKQKYPRSEMVIIGTGTQYRALQQMVERQKIHGVTFSGDVTMKRRRELFRESELYVNCSSVDYLSGATVEAFATGLPVLSTPLSGGSEAFRSREDTILLRYNDHVGLAERVIELVEDADLTEKLSNASRRTAEKYGRSPQRDAWSQVYRSLSRKTV